MQLLIIIFVVWYILKNNVGNSVMEVIDTVIVPDYIAMMAAAIQIQEGWYEGSRSYRNNNPGNLRWFSASIPWAGATGVDDSNHVIFDSYQSGYNALIHQLSIAFNNTSSVYNSSMTLLQFFQKYAEGNQSSYASNVASALGVLPSTTLDEIANG
jgi:hypothetical protein